MAIRNEPDEPPTLRERLFRPPGRYGLIAAGVALLLVIGGLVWFQTVGSTERVPRLVGLSEDAARIEAAKVGLKVKIGGSRYDQTVPKDQVAEVRPPAGTKVKKGTLLTLILSKGKAPVVIPDVKGHPLDEAKQILQQAGLQPGEEIQEGSTTVPRGAVIKTKPPAGEKQNPDDPVTLVVSAGILMPNLINQPRDKAAQTLAKLGLNVQWQEQAPAGGQQPNTVVGQNPPAGQPVNPGQQVQLVVTMNNQCAPWDLLCRIRAGMNQDTSPAAVPDVRNQPIAMARRNLRAAGFDVQVQNGGPRDPVTNENPPPGTQLPKGSTVTVWH
jgi:serine/threonine-protein kinase